MSRNEHKAYHPLHPIYILSGVIITVIAAMIIGEGRFSPGPQTPPPTHTPIVEKVTVVVPATLIPTQADAGTTDSGASANASRNGPPVQASTGGAEASPAITRIFFCDRPCNEAGAMRVAAYPEEATRIYAGFEYQGMKPGMRYTRSWSMNGEEWVRYECTWQGPESGVFYLKRLYESGGFRSGTWVMEVSVDGKTLSRTPVTVEGKHDYWAPAGVLPCNDW